LQTVNNIGDVSSSPAGVSKGSGDNLVTFLMTESSGDFAS
jgi:hypothetical protein